VTALIRTPGVIFDSSGALYGTTVYGGTFNTGTVYKLTSQGEGHRWTSTVLHIFAESPPVGIAPTDGVNPFAGVIFDSSGALYGTTVFGGNSANGTVYKLTPPADGGTPWNETVLYNFTGGADGRYGSSSLIFDSSGALYGTAGGGGNSGSGTVYKLTPPASGTLWNLTVLYAFVAVTGSNGGVDGVFPSYAPLIFDRSGALYGTTRAGGPCQGCGGGYGTVYKLTPPANGMPLGTPWTETVLHFFTSGADGSDPEGGVIFDRSGWTKTLLHSFSSAPDGANPFSGLILDRHDRLYGTTRSGGSVSNGGNGTVFRVE
jgi:uncharacterized repeat protein (TIGR03803 family)